jgi:hypothetical protein
MAGSLRCEPIRPPTPTYRRRRRHYLYTSLPLHVIIPATHTPTHTQGSPQGSRGARCAHGRTTSKKLRAVSATLISALMVPREVDRLPRRGERSGYSSKKLVVGVPVGGEAVEVGVGLLRFVAPVYHVDLMFRGKAAKLRRSLPHSVASAWRTAQRRWQETIARRTGIECVILCNCLLSTQLHVQHHFKIILHTHTLHTR